MIKGQVSLVDSPRRTRRGTLALLAVLASAQTAWGREDRRLTASEVIAKGWPPRELLRALRRGWPDETNADGDTAIHLAAAASNPVYLEILLTYGLSQNTPNSLTGRTPLVSAMMAERSVQFERLLAAGADPGRPDRTGNTPLHVAAQINDAGLALKLLEAGASPSARNAQGRTFQAYMDITPERRLSKRERRARERLNDYLRRQGLSPGADR
jgi:hypothetical protein